uniref:Uncharacterized protein n=1 Tax=Takifugu rubripes TaxID=31033 RepID=A0A674P4T8_TAKRU
VGALFRIATTCSPPLYPLYRVLLGPGHNTFSLFPQMAANVSCSGQISYDAFGQKIRVRSTGLASSETFYVDQLMLFRQKVYYEIDWLKSSCKKKPLDTAFIPMQVPFDAHATMQMFLGSSASWGMGVLVNSWSGPFCPSIGCIPMTFFSYMPTSGWSMISTFNWVLGNTNPMDFAPPSFCAKSKLEVTETPDNMFTALFNSVILRLSWDQRGF